MQPYISVVIPVYNGAAHITNAIESVKAQTFWSERGFAFEILVVDGSSIDGTQQILSELQETCPELCVINQNEGGGVSEARNIGISRAKGEYIAFLDSDDVWHRQKLSRQFFEIEKDVFSTQEDVFCLSYYEQIVSPPLFQRLTNKQKVCIDPSLVEVASRDIFGTKYRKKVFTEQELKKEICLGNLWFANGSSLLAHRSALEKTGNFVEKLRFGEDAEIIVRHLARGGQVKVAPRILVSYRVDERKKYQGRSIYFQYLLDTYTDYICNSFGKEAGSTFAKEYRLCLEKDKLKSSKRPALNFLKDVKSLLQKITP
jgi:glycosyltransferase involved in cell wall biosynthesis